MPYHLLPRPVHTIDADADYFTEQWNGNRTSDDPNNLIEQRYVDDSAEGRIFGPAHHSESWTGNTA